MARYTRRKSSAPRRNARSANSRSRGRTSVRRSTRAAPRRSVSRQQTIKIVVEQAPTTEAQRPAITADALRSATIESRRGKAKL